MEDFENPPLSRILHHFHRRECFSHFFINASYSKSSMVKVIYEGDNFKRMLRTDMIALQHLVDTKKIGIFEVDYKEGKIRVEIKKKGNDIIVKQCRMR